MTDKKDTSNTPIIRVGERLSSVFDEWQDRIRERAYHIFRNRDQGSGDSMADWLLAQSEVFTPIELEIKEQKKNIIVEGNLKGFSPAEIEIEVEGDVLKVFGQHSESSSEQVAAATESKSESRCFYQSVPLPAPVDLAETHAKLFKNGKLKVTLPKVSPPKN